MSDPEAGHVDHGNLAQFQDVAVWLRYALDWTHETVDGYFHVALESVADAKEVLVVILECDTEELFGGNDC